MTGIIILFCAFFIGGLQVQAQQNFRIKLEGNPKLNITTEMDSSGKIYEYINVCLGQTVTFTPTGNYYQNGQNGYEQTDENTTFTWTIIGDKDLAPELYGTPTEMKSFTHTFNSRYPWDIEITAKDVMNISADDPLTYRLRVADKPWTAIPTFDPICQGETIELGTSVDSVYANGFIVSPGIPVNNSIRIKRDTVFLPDDGGQNVYNSTVTFEGFAPNKKITNPIEDIKSISISMEHSSYRDLTMKLICPEGYEILLSDPSKSTANSVVLGIPATCGIKDACSHITIKGEPFTYKWSPIGTSSFLALSSMTAGSFIINPNTGEKEFLESVWVMRDDLIYRAEGDWNDLYGCSLNGDWKIEVKDNFRSDNGWMFGWSMELSSDLQSSEWDYSLDPEKIRLTSNEKDITVVDNGKKLAVRPSKSGTVEYDFSAIDEYNCVWDTTFTIEVIPAPYPNLPEDTILCDGETMILHANIAESTGRETIYWDNDGRETESIIIISEGTYKVIVTSEQDGYECKSSDEMNVTVYHMPTADFEVEGDCVPKSVLIKDKSRYGGEELSVTWNIFDGDGNLFKTSNEPGDLEVYIETPSNYTVELILTGDGGCTDIKRESLLMTQTPLADFVADPTISSLKDGGEVKFDNKTASEFESADWYWVFDYENAPEDRSTEAFSPTHTYSDWGDYVVMFHVSQGNCKDSVQHLVVIEADLEFPNVITPNGDGKNDVFAIKNLNTNVDSNDPEKYRSNSLHIYDRYGTRVYKAENYDTYYRDGDPHITLGEKVFDGKGLRDGVYYYRFVYKGRLKTTEFNGTVTIMTK